MSDDAGPDARRAILALLCVLGLVAASTAAPALAGDTPLGGLDSPRAPSEVPEFLLEMDALDWLFGDKPPAPSGSGETTFGALSLGQSTSVGGPISEEARMGASQTHFVATASGRTYWRTGAYIEYTGTGWEEMGSMRPFDHDEQTWSGQAEHVVELQRQATALPVVWTPTGVSTECGSGRNACGVSYSVTETGSIQSSAPLGTGTTYRVTAVTPPRSERVLERPTGAPANASDDDVVSLSSSRVQRAYTEVSTTVRVRSLASRVTNDAETRYDTVKAVENYLESEKTYSLSDVPEANDNVVDQFLFEQDAGYCEHFASSMVAMLRTQDVPARYVVGYAGGERVGENKYVVRGADAHAWVEVYFEDVGWVRFDPTPSAPRQAADEELRGSSAYRVGLNQTATPGEDITATVTAGGSPVSGVSVGVNGESVGKTDENGEVVFTVPYAEEIDIQIRGVNASSDESDTEYQLAADGVAVGGLNPGGASDPSIGDARLASVPPPGTELGITAANQDESPGTDDGNETEYTFPVNADVSLQFGGDVEPGETVTATVFVGDSRFPDASIRVAGERVGRTDAQGKLEVTIPEDASGVIELTASRGDISQTETYPVDGLTVSTSPSLVAPVPWTDATAHVSSGGEAVTDAIVKLDGEVVGRTDEHGNVQFEVPLSRVPEVSASASEKQAVTYVDGVLPTFVVVSLAALGALAGVVLTAQRRGVTVEGVVALLVRAASEAASLAVRAVVGFADAVDELAAEFREATREGWRGVLEWLASLPGRLRAPDVRAWLLSALAAVRDEDDETGAVTRSEGTAGGGASGRLQSVWRRFVSLVGVERWETKTPGEVARRAVRSGFPRRPVYALTNAFRDAAYGGRPEGESAERAQSALDDLDEDGADESGAEDGQ